MSTTTYMQVVNKVLVELDEVKLTSANFASATNIQEHVKDAVNRALYDINHEHYKWPFLATAVSTEPYLGNTYIESVAGTRWYLLKSTSTGVDTDYGYVDWEKFTLTTEGVTNETAPYTVRRLPVVSIDEWKRWRAANENAAEADSQTGSRALPKRVIRSMDGRYFGLSPLPDKVYRIYFFAWDQMSAVSAYDDTFAFQEQYVHSVLLPRVRYYAWQFKENSEQAALALQDWNTGIRRMREQLIEDKGKKEIRDNRIRHV